MLRSIFKDIAKGIGLSGNFSAMDTCTSPGTTLALRFFPFNDEIRRAPSDVFQMPDRREFSEASSRTSERMSKMVRYKKKKL